MVDQMHRASPASLVAPTVIAALAAAAVASGAARAQDPRPSLSTPSNQQPTRVSGPAPSSSQVPQQVDPSSADRNSLSGSLRVMPVDLSPHGFERVYSVPGRDDLLMRSNGALYAVFSQSVYSRDPRKGNLRVMIPASTVFYIGKPNFATIRSSGVRDVDLVPGSVPDERAAPTTMATVQGVRRVDAAPVDARVDPEAARIDGATNGRFRAPDRPADDPPVDVVHGPPSPAPVPATAGGRGPEAPASPAPDARESRPGFRARIDELMRRAKKAQ